MEMSELMRHLSDGLPDEIDGVKRYVKMSRVATEAGDDCEAAMLKQMAWEEHTHARHIMHILDRHGVDYTEYVPAFREAEAMLHAK